MNGNRSILLRAARGLWQGDDALTTRAYRSADDHRSGTRIALAMTHFHAWLSGSGSAARLGLVGVRRRLQYGPTAMQMNRHRLSINAWFALVLVLGSLWVGGLATASAGDAADYLAAKRAQQRMQSAALPDPVVALRPAPERSGWLGRLVLLLLAVLVSARAAGYWRRAVGPRPGSSWCPRRGGSLMLAVAPDSSCGGHDRTTRQPAWWASTWPGR
jgi:hypothetical protein